MKILFVAPRLHTNQYYTIKYLLRKNKVYFMSLFKGLTEDYRLIKPNVIKQSKFSIFLQSYFNLRFDTLYLPKIFKLIKKIYLIKPDLIIIRLYSRPLTYIVSSIGKIIGSKIIFYEQREAFNYKNFLSILKNFELKLSKLFFNAAYYSPILMDSSPKEKLPFVVKTKKNFNKINKDFKILMIGKFQARKGHILLIKAIENLLEKYMIKLTIIGEVSNHDHIKNYNFTKKYINEKKLKNFCNIKINQKYMNIEKEYTNCNLFVLPSHSEPAAISILEAQGFCKPVICSDTCGTKIYLKRDSSRVFKTNNLKSLISSIKYFLERKSQYQLFQKRSYENAIKNFSEKKFHKDFEKFLKLNYLNE